jgi:cbb3-type cytochrome oxidase subunit 3
MTHATAQAFAASTGLLIFVGLAILIVVNTFRRKNAAVYRDAAYRPLMED